MINTAPGNPQTVVDLVDGAAPVAPTNVLRLRNSNGVLATSANGIDLGPLAPPSLVAESTDRALIEKARIAALNTGINKFIDIPIFGQLPTTTVQATAFLNQAVVDGGGKLSTGGIDYFGGAIFNNFGTKPGSFTCYAKILGPTAARTASVETINAGNSHITSIGTDNAISTTNYVLKAINGTTNLQRPTTMVADQAWHYFTVVSDPRKTGLTLAFVDGNRIDDGAISAASNVDELLALCMFSTAAGDVAIQELFAGYAQP
jgi:hypothetical protein